MKVIPRMRASHETQLLQQGNLLQVVADRSVQTQMFIEGPHKKGESPLQTTSHKVKKTGLNGNQGLITVAFDRNAPQAGMDPL